MKRIIALILCTAIAVSVVGCSFAPASSKASSAPSSSTAVSSVPASSSVSSAQGIEVDKGLLDVTITLPASMFNNTDLDEATANAKKEGVGEVTKNSDGSVTYKMSKATHKKMMDEIKISLIASIDQAKNGTDYTSIKDITYNDDFSQITLVVDKSKYENSLDGFAALNIYLGAAYYQLFSGTKSDDIKATFKIQDAATKKILDTMVYPDDLEENSSSK